MEEVTNKSYPATFNDLIKEMEKGDYKHLQIFLFRKKPDLGFVEDAQFLVVCRDGFGIYKLHNLDYKDGKIQIQLINPEDGKSSTVNLDIHNTKPDLFILSWQDVLDLAKDIQPDNDEEIFDLDRN